MTPPRLLSSVEKHYCCQSNHSKRRLSGLKIEIHEIHKIYEIHCSEHGNRRLAVYELEFCTGAGAGMSRGSPAGFPAGSG